LLGQRHYYPIYAAAQEQQLPVAIHPFNEGSGTAPAPTASGYPSHYLEFHTACILNVQAHLVSLIYEGVFERFPKLVFVFVECGVGWLPTLLWRLDREWKSLRIEVPWVKRKPSEYVAEHVRFTTQPLDEPDSLAHLHQLFDMFPAGEVLLFSSDYPHWDYDRPAYIAARLPGAIRERVMSENARVLYNLK
jgi:predicted TIM-barrel fold metal-dependent hydrolase